MNQPNGSINYHGSGRRVGTDKNGRTLYYGPVAEPPVNWDRQARVVDGVARCDHCDRPAMRKYENPKGKYGPAHLCTKHFAPIARAQHKEYQAQARAEKEQEP